MEINGKVAVITGGASGIGRATAELLASGGAAVIIADLVETLGDETVKAIEAAGGRAAFVKADVTNEDDARRMLDTAVQKFGGLDILYNNAGIAVGVPGYPQAEIKRWRRVIEIDLVSRDPRMSSGGAADGPEGRRDYQYGVDGGTVSI